MRFSDAKKLNAGDKVLIIEQAVKVRYTDKKKYVISLSKIKMPLFFVLMVICIIIQH